MLVLKRPDEDKFRWPRCQETGMRLATEHLHWILDGCDGAPSGAAIPGRWLRALEFRTDPAVRFRSKNPMNRTSEPSIAELMAQIAALQPENRQLTGRVFKLEEKLALARPQRFASKSEKHVDRLFDEPEQVADEAAAAELPDYHTRFAFGCDTVGGLWPQADKSSYPVP